MTSEEVQPPDAPLDEAPFIDEEVLDDAVIDEEAPSDADDGGETPAEPAAEGEAAAAAATSSMPALDKEPFDWEKITITLVIQYLPTDGDPAGRQVMMGVRNSKDSPIVRLLRESEIGELPTCIQELLTELRASLPNRQLRSLKAKAKTAPRKPKPAAAPAQAPAMPAVAGIPVVTPPAKPAVASTPKPKPAADGAGQISMF